MKGLWLITTLFFAGIITMQACGEKAITQKEKDEIINAYLKSMEDSFCNPCKIPTSNTAAYLLNTNMLKEMAENYNQLAYNKRITNKVIQNRPSQDPLYPGTEPDVRAIWFSIERLKGFVREIEKGYCGKTCEKSQLGIRIYYARYPDSSKYKDLIGIPRDFENRHTVFMVPTYFNGKHHEDFDPRYFDKGCKPTSLSVVMGAEPSQRADTSLAKTMFALMSTIDNTSMNHGGIIPPPYDNFFRNSGAYFIY